MLYLIGLGLGDAKDITVKGLEVVKQAKRVYLEAYTSLLSFGKDALEEFYGREVILGDRETIEQQLHLIVQDAKSEDIAILVVGDPFGATTHVDFMLHAKLFGVEYSVIPNASIMNAVGCCGLQLHRFGEAVSIRFWTDTWKPGIYYHSIAGNMERGAHTLCLLDIRIMEQTVENLMEGRKIYKPDRFMTVCEAASQLLAIVERRKDRGEESAYNEDTLCVGIGRIGWDTQKIIAGSLQQMTTVDLGPPMHSLVIVGQLHPKEHKMLQRFATTPILPRRAARHSAQRELPSE